MAGNHVTGDGLSANLAGMSKNQLYDIMSQMKTLIDMNQDQARQILIQNPLLTKALFQAQIMLGMVKPPQEIPNILPAGSQHPHQPTPPAQQPNVQATPLPVQSGLRDQTSASTQQNQTTIPLPSSSIPPSNPSVPSHPLPPVQLTRGHLNAQTTPMPLPQSSQLLNMAPLSPHYSTQAPTPLERERPLHMSSIPHLPLQPPLPSQPRPPSMPAFPHQNYSHMGPNAGYPHPGAPQLHHSQPVFHSGSRPPTSMGPPFSQGQPPLPNQQPPQTFYQGGGSHVGMDFNQMGIPAQTERGTHLPGPSPPFLPPSQPPRPASLSADMEKALLQQVMSLTPEQINLLPPDQRNQVLHLQQMLRQ